MAAAPKRLEGKITRIRESRDSNVDRRRRAKRTRSRKRTSAGALRAGARQTIVRAVVDRATRKLVARGVRGWGIVHFLEMVYEGNGDES